MSIFMLMLTLVTNPAGAEEKSQTDNSILSKNWTVGAGGGFGYGSLSGSRGFIEFQVQLRSIAFSSNDNGKWEGAAFVIIFPTYNDLVGSGILLGHALSEDHRLSAGVFAGLGAATRGILPGGGRDVELGLSWGARVSYDASISGRWSVSPQLFLFNSGVSTPGPTILLALELRYTGPFAGRTY